MKHELYETLDRTFRGHWWGYAVGMAVTFSLSGPLLAFVPAPSLYTMGLIAGGIVFCGHWAFRYLADWDGKVMMVVAIGLVVLSGFAAQPLIDEAVSDSRANDRRCLVIQRDMLSSKPKRDDSADLFQALGCRPHGTGKVYAQFRK